jgi:hypothetical protein
MFEFFYFTIVTPLRFTFVKKLYLKAIAKISLVERGKSNTCLFANKKVESEFPLNTLAESVFPLT